MNKIYVIKNNINDKVYIGKHNIPLKKDSKNIVKII